MAIVLKQYFRVISMTDTGQELVAVNLTEEIEEEDGVVYNPRSNLNIAVSKEDAVKFLPGTRFEVSFTPKAS